MPFMNLIKQYRYGTVNDELMPSMLNCSDISRHMMNYQRNAIPRWSQSRVIQKGTSKHGDDAATWPWVTRPGFKIMWPCRIDRGSTISDWLVPLSGTVNRDPLPPGDGVTIEEEEPPFPHVHCLYVISVTASDIHLRRCSEGLIRSRRRPRITWPSYQRSGSEGTTTRHI